jgi:alkylation response protein AidB-like acyl-CoA dehydrogenase
MHCCLTTACCWAPAHEAPAIKYLVTQNAIAAVELAVEASGNPGLSRNNALERHHRDVLCSRIHTPQNDALLGALGRAAFAGLAAYHANSSDSN